MILLLYGTNHTKLEVQEREELAFSDEEIPEILAEIVSDSHVEEACVVNTCNRVEFYIYGDDGACVPQLVRSLYERRRGIDIRAYPDGFYLLQDDDAVHHLFRVIASLDSMVLGEVDVVHQLKRMYQIATESGTSGLVLDRAFHQAFKVAKKVRSETAISAGTTSVAMIAVEYVKRQLVSLKDSHATVVGSGPMALRMARYLKKRGIGSLTLANRTPSKIDQEAKRLGASTCQLADLDSAILESDLVMVSVKYNRQYLINAEDIRRIGNMRRSKLIIVDIGVPRVVEQVEDCPENVEIFNLEDFYPVLEENISRRKAAAEEAERIIEKSVQRFVTWRAEAVILPDIIRLRQKVKQICDEEVAKLADTLPADYLEAVREFATALSERIIKTPIQTLRARVFSSDRDESLVQFRELFELDRSEEVLEGDGYEIVDESIYHKRSS